MDKNKILNLIESLNVLEEATQNAQKAAEDLYQDQKNEIDRKLVAAVKKKFYLVDRTKLYRTLIELRMKANISKREMTRRLHCSSSLITYWEAGRGVPSPRYLVAIADVFQIPVETFFKKENSFNSENENK